MDTSAAGSNIPMQLGHSPDSDDAFMFYGLAEHKVPSDGFAFEHVLRDIQTLNEWAREGKLEITAISVYAYAFVADKYAILSHGASMGDNYGPMVVTREPHDVAWLRGKKIAIPGTMTSAFLALRLFLGDFEYDVVRLMRSCSTSLTARLTPACSSMKGNSRMHRSACMKS